jgi:hypothetical protein
MKDPSLVLKADDFVTLKQDHLLEFLIHYNNSLSQIEVWDKLIEWAIAKSNKLPSDVTEWTDDNIKAFGDLIKPFISHIKFQKINRLDFLQKNQ